ncbi:MAG TPA: CpaD family pilus assembly lipoprotein, partial [Sphingomonas sp.]|nr:CpaD family pilus assembly lipoprotein [Sphingomonas sp.]
VSGGSATVPGCPDWSDGEINPGETMAANFGCATQMNLAAMIADPQDLVSGKSSPTDAVQIARALKVWREQIPTGAQALEKIAAKGGGG